MNDLGSAGEGWRQNKHLYPNDSWDQGEEERLGRNEGRKVKRMHLQKWQVQ